MSIVCILLAVAGWCGYNSRKVGPQIAVTKAFEQAGGRYVINGTGYQGDEVVSLNIQNAPLMQPGNWHLGNASSVNGSFSFRTEDFRCVRVDDQRLREQYKKQRVIFVATGLSSGHAATAMDTAGGILMCP